MEKDIFFLILSPTRHIPLSDHVPDEVLIQEKVFALYNHTFLCRAWRLANAEIAILIVFHNFRSSCIWIKSSLLNTGFQIYSVTYTAERYCVKSEFSILNKYFPIDLHIIHV